MSCEFNNQGNHLAAHWLPSLQKDWSLVRLKYVLATSITDGPHETPAFVAEGIPFLSVDGIQDGELIFEGCRCVSPEDHARYRLKASPRRNDILLGKAASTGKIARVRVDFEFSIWSPLALIRFRGDRIVPAFGEYCLKSAPLQAQIDILCTSNTQKNISMNDIPRVLLPLPPLHTQHAIADFLDRKTRAIDELIRKKERLIELLQEKRQALITQAVTKGLDPNVPMKDSGVPWLGEIPAHWEVKRLKYVAKLESGHTPSRSVPEYWLEDNEIPWVSLNDTKFLASNDYISDTAFRINEMGLANSSARLLPERVVVFTRDATIGEAAITTRPMAVSQHIIAWVCGPDLIPEYLLRVFGVMRGELDRLTMGATLKTIGMADVRSLVTPLPRVDEQNAIVQALTGHLACLGSTRDKLSAQIRVLHEYRQALISAAVTGQIDVTREIAA